MEFDLNDMNNWHHVGNIKKRDNEFYIRDVKYEDYKKEMIEIEEDGIYVVTSLSFGPIVTIGYREKNKIK